MKITSGIITAALVLSVLLSGYTSASPQASVESGFITVTGDAEVRVVPDEVILTLGVQTWNKNLDVAKRQNDQITAKVLALTKKYGINPNHVQTDYINIEPRYDDNYEASGFIGFFVRKTIVITLKDISEFEDFLTDVLKTGVNFVHGIEFRTTELRKYRDQARSLAIKAAKEKAGDLAKELDQSLGKPTSIREDRVGWWSWYGSGWWGSGWSSMSQNVVQNAGGNAPMTEGGIAPGQITVNARVSVTFELQ